MVTASLSMTLEAVFVPPLSREDQDNRHGCSEDDFLIFVCPRTTLPAAVVATVAENVAGARLDRLVWIGSREPGAIQY